MHSLNTIFKHVVHGTATFPSALHSDGISSLPWFNAYVRSAFYSGVALFNIANNISPPTEENKKQRSRPRKPRKTRNEENEQDGDLEGPVIDESVLSAKELLGLQQAEERLKRDCVDRLKRVTSFYVYLLVRILVWA